MVLPVKAYLKGWRSFFYTTDGYAIYSVFIDNADHIVKKLT